MLTIIVGGDGFDEQTNKFVTINPTPITLEHSLLSLSKWESKYQRPFLSKDEKTREEMFDYLQMMIVSPDVDPELMFSCSKENLDEIRDYIDSPQSATTFGMLPERRGPGETITSELIYYWLVAFTISFEVETWHLNRLFSLVRICTVKNAKPKQMSKNEMAQQRAELNAQRKAQLNSRG